MEERLRKFGQLVDAGSFTKAAAELHVSQPALSSAIAKLERELKATLLVRGTRPLVLTPTGKLAYQAAKDLAVQKDNLRLRLAELAHEPVALHIGMIDSVADTLFDSSVNLGLLDAARVSIVVNNSRYLTEVVERGGLDIAFIAEQPKHVSGVLETTPVAAEPLVVVAHASQPPLRGNKLPGFISYNQSSSTFHLVQRALRGYGVVPQASFYSTSPEVMLRLVLINKGIAALPYLMVRGYVKSGTLKRLGNRTAWLIPRNIISLRRRDKEPPQVLNALVGQVADLVNRLMNEASE